MQLIRSYRPKGDAAVTDLEAIGNRLAERVTGLLSLDKPQYGICHGDHHGANAMVDEHGHITLFDFDCFGYGWRAYDISVFLWSKTGFGDWSRKGTARRRRLWDAFVQGYNEIRRLDEEELEAVKAFVPIRHIFLMGLHMGLIPKFGQTGVARGLNRHINFVREWVRRYRVV